MLQNFVSVLMKTAENREQKKKTKGILGSSFFIRGLQLMTDEWQTQGGKYHRALASLHHRNWCYFEGDKILIYYIAGSCPFIIWGRGVCVCWGGEGVQSLGTPLSQIPRVQIQFTLTQQFPSYHVYDKAGNVQFELKMRVIIKHR